MQQILRKQQQILRRKTVLVKTQRNGKKSNIYQSFWNNLRWFQCCAIFIPLLGDTGCTLNINILLIATNFHNKHMCLLKSSINFVKFTDSRDCLRCPNGQWPNDNHSACVFMSKEFLEFKSPETLFIISFALLGFTISVTMMILLMWNHNKLAQVNKHFSLSVCSLFALAGCFGSTVAFVGEPTCLTCKLRLALPCTSLTLTILFMMMMVVREIMDSNGNGVLPCV